MGSKQQYYQTFIDSLSNSPTTRAKYIRELNYYLVWLKVKDPNRLITPTLLNSQTAIHKVEDQIVKYVKYLKENERLSYNTIHVRIFAIVKFYSINRIKLDSKHIGRFKPANKRLRKDLAYTHEQIGEMLSNADIRGQMTILLMASSGMRIGALHNLTIGNLHKVIVEGYPGHIYKIVVYEGESEEHYTFTSFECAAVIDDYLNHRVHFGEQLTEDSPLIRDEYDYRNKKHAMDAHPVTKAGIVFIIDRILIKSMLKTRTTKKDRHLHPVMFSHGLRKFCITQFKKAKVDYSDREFFVGHFGTRGLDVNYDRTNEEDRLSEYVKAIDLLTISQTNILKKKIGEQEHTIQVQLARKDKQIHELMQFKHEMQVLLREPEKFVKMLTENKN